MATSKKKPKVKADKAGVEPSTRVFTTWTPALLRAAEVQADSGNLRLAANVCDWLLGDDRVAGTIQTRVQALLGLEPSFERSGDKRRSARAVKALEVQEDWWAAYPETELFLIHAWGILLGVAPARHAWEANEDHGGRVLPCPAFWHPQHLRFDWTTREWKIRVQPEKTGLGVGLEQTLTPGDGTWILHAPYGFNRPWAVGLSRGLSVWVLLKHLAMGDWARHSEKASLLAATNTFKDEDGLDQLNNTERAALAQEIYERGRAGVVVLPPNFDLKLVEATANTREIYEAQINAANTAIAVAIRGGNLTTEVQGGSRAAASVQERLGDQQRLQFDAQSLTTTIHDQSLVWWAEFNFGDPKLAPWPVYPTKPPKDSKSKVEVFQKVMDASARAEALGWEVDRAKLAEEFELTEFLKPGTPKGDLTIQQGVPDAPGGAGQGTQDGADGGTGGGKAEPEPGKGSKSEPGKSDSDNDDEEEDDDARDESEGQPKAHRHAPVWLASGASLADASGFVNGQLYADALVERAAARAIKLLGADLEAIERELDAAESYDDLRERLRALYETLDPEALSSLLEATMVLGELAGRAAVNQDV